ncbi:hypothetical protein WDW37_11430 [Bdellovibrionota bacterium FG-1]
MPLGITFKKRPIVTNSSAGVVTAPPDRADWVVAFFCLLLGLLGLRAVNDPVLWNELLSREGVTEVMGSLERKQGGVRFKAHGSPLWHDLVVGAEDLSAGDTVFTAEDGKAHLLLKDGSSADIMPGSLIVVGRTAELEGGPSDWLKGAFRELLTGRVSSSILKVEKGSAKVNLNKDATPTRLKIKDKLYMLSSHIGGSSADVTVDIGANPGEVSARFSSGSAGKVQIQEETGQKISEVGAGETALVREGSKGLELQPISVALGQPSPGDRLLRNPEQPVAFTWRWDSAGMNVASIELTDASVSDQPQVIKISGPEQIVKVPLKAGVYRWRIVQGEKGARFETNWRQFTLMNLIPPRPAGPIAGTVIRVPVGASSAPVVFSWVGQGAPFQTELEWNTSRTITSHSGHQAQLGVGDYQWRVRSVSDGGRSSDWSGWIHFSVRATSLASNAEMDSPLVVPSHLKSDVPIPVFTPTPRIRPKASVPFKPNAVVVRAPIAKPGLESPSLKAGSGVGSTQLGSSETLDQLAIPLHWGAVPDAKSYTVRVLDLKGVEIASQSVTQPSWVWSLQSLIEVKFQYQVIAILASGKKIMSSWVPIDIKLTAPPLKTPVNGAKTALHTAGTSGAILMTWERTVLTEKYELTIAEDPEFRERVRTEVVSRNLFALKGMKAGTFYWRVRSRAFGHLSGWSDVSSFTLTTGR